MLNRLPKWPGELAEILADIGNPPAAKIAKALGVSKRTVERWKHGKTPRVALLSLWWLSREGHSVWDCEMQNLTALTAATNAALWQTVKYGRQDAKPTGLVQRHASAANDAAWSTAEVTA
ncbi:hypothetical protein ABT392_16810 [Paucibacter sp. JuS9]|uniref:hypothetical protein n=1 Tax=Paucibacter sp. JuS9 TaxID=3228748 RepID=UPI003756CE69